MPEAVRAGGPGDGGEADGRWYAMSERTGDNGRPGARHETPTEIRAGVEARAAVRAAEMILGEAWQAHLVSLREESERELCIGLELRGEMRDRLSEIRGHVDARELAGAEAELSAAERVTAEGAVEYAELDAYVSQELRHLEWATRRRDLESRGDELRLAALRAGGERAEDPADGTGPGA